MTRTPQGRLFSRGFSLRTKAFLSLIALLPALAAAGWLLIPVPRDHAIWPLLAAVAATFGLVLLVIESLFIRKIRQLDRELLALAGNTESDEPGPAASRDEFARLSCSLTRLLGSLQRRCEDSEEREQVLLSVLDSSSEGILAFRSLRNEDGVITDFILALANKAAEGIFNRKAEEMTGRCLLGLFPGSLGEGVFDRYVRVVETKTGMDFEVFHGHEEVRSWFHLFAEPWDDGLVVTFEEIGARKRAEQELKASIEELERFNRAMIGREDRILEMKTEVNRLRSRLGLPPAYKVDASNDEL